MTITTMETAEKGPRSYGNWSKPKTAGLLGLSALGTAILFVGAGFSVLVCVDRAEQHRKVPVPESLRAALVPLFVG